ncbi:MAG: hypothetical protein HYY18_08930 [Planctomycetes bacterium]|nr:hypothetical protein [Planctomycetota bacterium]
MRALALLLLLQAPLWAQLPEGFEVYDTPGDEGSSALAVWKALPKETADASYVVWRAPAKDGPWEEVARFPQTAGWKSDAPQHFGTGSGNKGWHWASIPALAEPGKPPVAMWVKLGVEGAGGAAESAPAEVTPVPNWWAWNKLNVFLFVVAFTCVTFWLISRARRDPNLFIRRIPGLDAMEEAIGRATEMGKPILYLNGLNAMDSISTIASTCILGQVAKRVAAYDTTISVPCFDPVVMGVSQEVMREGFIAAGRPDSYRSDAAFFVTSDQFGYVAAVDGIMIREKPAACFYLGYYYAESLLLAETGATTGAIQIAGTDSVTQLPFFIATCDYTLIGEELYAASAYLSREPIQLGSLIAQDWGKLFLLAMILLGTVVGSAAVVFRAPALLFLKDLFATYS